MCLTHQVSKKVMLKALQKTKVGSGHKVFQADGFSLWSYIRGNGLALPVGKWLNERDYRLSAGNDRLWASNRSEYPTGWHIYLGPYEPCHIEPVHTRAVRFRQPVAWGYQDTGKLTPTVVAREMFIEAIE